MGERARAVQGDATARAPAGLLTHVLTPVEFDVLWEQARLGATPVALGLPSPGRTAAERRHIVAASWGALCARGLAGPDGPDPDLERLMHLLARPATRFELRGSWSVPVRAVAAGGADGGVLAVRSPDAVTLSACSSSPPALLTALPAARSGPGRAATVPTSVLSVALGARGRDLRAALISRGVVPTEAGLLARMLTPGRGQAQIVALAVDATGAAHRAGGVLGVLDGPAGRYQLTRMTGEDGVEWVTVAPTDLRRLRYRMDELARSVPEVVR